MVLNICTSSDDALYFVLSFMKLSQRVIEQTLKITKGAYFRKNIGGVMVLNLCTSSDQAIYLYQV